MTQALLGRYGGKNMVVRATVELGSGSGKGLSLMTGRVEVKAGARARVTLRVKMGSGSYLGRHGRQEYGDILS